MHAHGHSHAHCHGPDAHRWDMLLAMGRRGFGRFGMPGGGFGNWGNFGDGMRFGRMLASGDLRLIALHLIEQQPRHGYDLIKAIEDMTAGFYSPSPGIVYPALTFLEEAGYVTSSAEGNKKLYTITHEGRSHLEQNREAISGAMAFLARAGEHMRHWRERQGGEGEGRDSGGRPFRRPGPDRDVPGVSEAFNAARRDLKAAISEALEDGDEASQQRVADILSKAAELIRRRNVDL